MTNFVADPQCSFVVDVSPSLFFKVGRAIRSLYANDAKFISFVRSNAAQLVGVEPVRTLARLWLLPAETWLSVVSCKLVSILLSSWFFRR